ncbi:mevalonate kinase [Streptomyces sp. NBC_00287]|uniref:mevalonate kinase n=1 Tax=Streptomyces sp. NBC_00287 TaxID=2975702 RepID=UPI002E2D2F05|nr:mevalonate kinase [Streptomyces sp. NBC_00287]
MILLGEHSVVYGAPALALPIPELTVTASAAQSSHPSAEPGDVTFTMAGQSGPVAMEASEGLRRLVAEFKETTGRTGSPHIDVLIDCAIPTGRGLGSSAACAQAVVLALADLVGVSLDSGTVFDLVQIAENVTHGRASGIDTLATGSPFPVLLSGGFAREPRIGFDGAVVVADSGVAGRTKDGVEMLRRAFERDPETRADFVGRATELTTAAVRDLAAGRAEAFGGRLTDCHALLAGAGLSTDRIDGLVEAALSAGALGAKISGGGLGGCMIALAGSAERARETERRLGAAGAVRTWVVPIERFSGHAR